ncbi:TPA: hypothetical protein HA361_01235 [Candidatus Woesearchaeota archaeon]|nr:hypothetical protein [Candidatus Woesearchaeota archaeon]
MNQTLKKLGKEELYSLLLELSTMFEQIIKILNENKKLIPQFKTRLNLIIEPGCEGWGHKDTLMEIYEELKDD